MQKVAVFLADGFEEIEALTVVDILRRASIYVDTISITEQSIVAGAHGINVQTEDLFEDVNFDEFEMLVLPGGMPGTINLKEHKGLRALIRKFNEEGKTIAAICAAPSIFGDMGLLQGRKATSYPSVEDQLNGALVERKPVVKDGNIITSRGMGTAIDFALALVEELTEAEKAETIAESIIYHQ